MKHLKKFEVVTSSSYANDKEYIKNLEEDITSIFLNLLDDDFDLNIKATDYGGNISNISIKNPKFSNATFIEDFLPSIEHFYDYIKSEGFKFHHISINGQWILGGPDGTYWERERAISFGTYEWKDIRDILIDRAGNRRVSSITINFLKK